MGRSARQGVGHRRRLGLIGIALLLSACAGAQRQVDLFPAAPPPDPWAARVDAARRLVDDGLYDQAQAAVAALVTERCPHAEVPHLRARLAFQARDWPAALDASAQAMAASPGWGEPRILHARTLLELKRWSDADALFADIETAIPDSPYGPYGRAVVAVNRGDHQAARVLAARALAIDPRLAPALRLLAGLARITGDAAAEDDALRRAVGADGGDRDDWLRLGELAVAAGRRIDAQRWWADAWAAQPTPALARRLAELAAQNGDGEAERRWRERAGTADLKTDPSR